LANLLNKDEEFKVAKNKFTSLGVIVTKFSRFSTLAIASEYILEELRAFLIP